MNPNKALWEKGDFTRIAETMRQSGEELVAKLGITKSMKILDLGCGDGTTAIPEAQLGAEVLGVDADIQASMRFVLFLSLNFLTRFINKESLVACSCLGRCRK